MAASSLSTGFPSSSSVGVRNDNATAAASHGHQRRCEGEDASGIRRTCSNHQGGKKRVGTTTMVDAASDGPRFTDAETRYAAVRHKGYALVSEEQLRADADQHNILVGIHGHHLKSAGAKKLLYVTASTAHALQRRTSARDVALLGVENEHSADDVTLCLLQPSVGAGNHECRKVALVLKDVLITRFSKYHNATYGSVYFSISPLVQCFLKALNEKFDVTLSPNPQEIKVRCEVDSVGVPLWTTVKEIPTDDCGRVSGRFVSSCDSGKLTENQPYNQVQQSVSTEEEKKGVEDALETAAHANDKAVGSAQVEQARTTATDPPKPAYKSAPSHNTSLPEGDDDLEEDFTAAVNWLSVGGKRRKKHAEAVGGTKIKAEITTIEKTTQPVMVTSPASTLVPASSHAAERSDRNKSLVLVDLTAARDHERYNEEANISSLLPAQGLQETSVKADKASVGSMAEVDAGMVGSCGAYIGSGVTTLGSNSTHNHAFLKLQCFCRAGKTRVNAVVHCANVCPYQQSNALILYLVEIHLKQDALDPQAGMIRSSIGSLGNSEAAFTNHLYKRPLLTSPPSPLQQEVSLFAIEEEIEEKKEDRAGTGRKRFELDHEQKDRPNPVVHDACYTSEGGVATSQHLALLEAEETHRTRASSSSIDSTLKPFYQLQPPSFPPPPLRLRHAFDPVSTQNTIPPSSTSLEDNPNSGEPTMLSLPEATAQIHLNSKERASHLQANIPPKEPVTPCAVDGSTSSGEIPTVASAFAGISPPVQSVSLAVPSSSQRSITSQHIPKPGLLLPPFQKLQATSEECSVSALDTSGGDMGPGPPPWLLRMMQTHRAFEDSPALPVSRPPSHPISSFLCDSSSSSSSLASSRLPFTACNLLKKTPSSDALSSKVMMVSSFLRSSSSPSNDPNSAVSDMAQPQDVSSSSSSPSLLPPLPSVSVQENGHSPSHLYGAPPVMPLHYEHSQQIEHMAPSATGAPFQLTSGGSTFQAHLESQQHSDFQKIRVSSALSHESVPLTNETTALPLPYTLLQETAPHSRSFLVSFTSHLPSSQHETHRDKEAEGSSDPSPDLGLRLTASVHHNSSPLPDSVLTQSVISRTPAAPVSQGASSPHLNSSVYSHTAKTQPLDIVTQRPDHFLPNDRPLSLSWKPLPHSGMCDPAEINSHLQPHRHESYLSYSSTKDGVVKCHRVLCPTEDTHNTAVPAAAAACLSSVPLPSSLGPTVSSYNATVQCVESDHSTALPLHNLHPMSDAVDDCDGGLFFDPHFLSFSNRDARQFSVDACSTLSLNKCLYENSEEEGERPSPASSYVFDPTTALDNRWMSMIRRHCRRGSVPEDTSSSSSSSLSSASRPQGGSSLFQDSLTSRVLPRESRYWDSLRPPAPDLTDHHPPSHSKFLHHPYSSSHPSLAGLAHEVSHAPRTRYAFCSEDASGPFLFHTNRNNDAHGAPPVPRLLDATKQQRRQTVVTRPVGSDASRVPSGSAGYAASTGPDCHTFYVGQKPPSGDPFSFPPCLENGSCSASTAHLPPLPSSKAALTCWDRFTSVTSGDRVLPGQPAGDSNPLGNVNEEAPPESVLNAPLTHHAMRPMLSSCDEQRRNDSMSPESGEHSQRYCGYHHSQDSFRNQSHPPPSPPSVTMASVVTRAGLRRRSSPLAGSQRVASKIVNGVATKDETKPDHHEDGGDNDHEMHDSANPDERKFHHCNDDGDNAEALASTQECTYWEDVYRRGKCKTHGASTLSTNDDFLQHGCAPTPAAGHGATATTEQTCAVQHRLRDCAAPPTPQIPRCVSSRQRCSIDLSNGDPFMATNTEQEEDDLNNQQPHDVQSSLTFSSKMSTTDDPCAALMNSRPSRSLVQSISKLDTDFRCESQPASVSEPVIKTDLLGYETRLPETVLPRTTQCCQLTDALHPRNVKKRLMDWQATTTISVPHSIGDKFERTSNITSHQVVDSRVSGQSPTSERSSKLQEGDSKAPVASIGLSGHLEEGERVLAQPSEVLENKALLDNFQVVNSANGTKIAPDSRQQSFKNTLYNEVLPSSLSVGDLVEIKKVDGRRDIFENQKAEIVSVSSSDEMGTVSLTVAFCRRDGQRFRNEQTAVREGVPIECVRLLERAEDRRRGQAAHSCPTETTGVSHTFSLAGITTDGTFAPARRRFFPNFLASPDSRSSHNCQGIGKALSGAPGVGSYHAFPPVTSSPSHKLLVGTPFSLHPPRNREGVLCFFWDLEATGLHVGYDDITQIACVCRRFFFDTVKKKKNKRVTHNSIEDALTHKTSHFSTSKSAEMLPGTAAPSDTTPPRSRRHYMNRFFAQEEEKSLGHAAGAPESTSSSDTEEEHVVGLWEVVSGYPEKEFNCYVYTDRVIPDPVVELTGITNAFLNRHGISFSHALAEWAEWILSTKRQYENCPVWFVAHNGNRYDLPLLFQQELRKLGQEPGTFLRKVGAVGIVDTVVLSRRLPWGDLGPHRRSHKLQSLYYDLFQHKMPNEHDALGDVTGLAALMDREPFLFAWCNLRVGWPLDEYLFYSDGLWWNQEPPGPGRHLHLQHTAEKDNGYYSKSLQSFNDPSSSSSHPPPPSSFSIAHYVGDAADPSAQSTVAIATNGSEGMFSAAPSPATQTFIDTASLHCPVTEQGRLDVTLAASPSGIAPHPAHREDKQSASGCRPQLLCFNSETDSENGRHSLHVTSLTMDSGYPSLVSEARELWKHEKECSQNKRENNSAPSHHMEEGHDKFRCEPINATPPTESAPADNLLLYQRPTRRSLTVVCSPTLQAGYREKDNEAGSINNNNNNDVASTLTDRPAGPLLNGTANRRFIAFKPRASTTIMGETAGTPPFSQSSRTGWPAALQELTPVRKVTSDNLDLSIEVTSSRNNSIVSNHHNEEQHVQRARVPAIYCPSWDDSFLGCVKDKSSRKSPSLENEAEETTPPEEVSPLRLSTEYHHQDESGRPRASSTTSSSCQPKTNVASAFSSQHHYHPWKSSSSSLSSSSVGDYGSGKGPFFPERRASPSTPSPPSPRSPLISRSSSYNNIVSTVQQKANPVDDNKNNTQDLAAMPFQNTLDGLGATRNIILQPENQEVHQESKTISSSLARTADTPHNASVTSPVYSSSSSSSSSMRCSYPCNTVIISTNNFLETHHTLQQSASASTLQEEEARKVEIFPVSNNQQDGDQKSDPVISTCKGSDTVVALSSLSSLENHERILSPGDCHNIEHPSAAGNVCSEQPPQHQMLSETHHLLKKSSDSQLEHFASVLHDGSSNTSAVCTGQNGKRNHHEQGGALLGFSVTSIGKGSKRSFGYGIHARTWSRPPPLPPGQEPLGSVLSSTSSVPGLFLQSHASASSPSSNSTIAKGEITAKNTTELKRLDMDDSNFPTLPASAASVSHIGGEGGAVSATNRGRSSSIFASASSSQHYRWAAPSGIPTTTASQHPTRCLGSRIRDLPTAQHRVQYHPLSRFSTAFPGLLLSGLEADTAEEAEKSSVPEGDLSVSQEKSSTRQEKSSTRQEKSSTLQKESTTFEEKLMTLQKESPVFQEERPSLHEQLPDSTDAIKGKKSLTKRDTAAAGPRVKNQITTEQKETKDSFFPFTATSVDKRAGVPLATKESKTSAGVHPRSFPRSKNALCENNSSTSTQMSTDLPAEPTINTEIPETQDPQTAIVSSTSIDLIEKNEEIKKPVTLLNKRPLYLLSRRCPPQQQQSQICVSQIRPSSKGGHTSPSHDGLSSSGSERKGVLLPIREQTVSTIATTTITRGPRVLPTQNNHSSQSVIASHSRAKHDSCSSSAKSRTISFHAEGGGPLPYWDVDRPALTYAIPTTNGNQKKQTSSCNAGLPILPSSSASRTTLRVKNNEERQQQGIFSPPITNFEGITPKANFTLFPKASFPHSSYGGGHPLPLSNRQRREGSGPERKRFAPLKLLVRRNAVETCSSRPPNGASHHSPANMAGGAGGGAARVPACSVPPRHYGNEYEAADGYNLHCRSPPHPSRHATNVVEPTSRRDVAHHNNLHDRPLGPTLFGSVRSKKDTPTKTPTLLLECNSNPTPSSVTDIPPGYSNTKLLRRQTTLTQGSATTLEEESLSLMSSEDQQPSQSASSSDHRNTLTDTLNNGSNPDTVYHDGSGKGGTGGVRHCQQLPSRFRQASAAPAPSGSQVLPHRPVGRLVVPPGTGALAPTTAAGTRMERAVTRNSLSNPDGNSVPTPVPHRDSQKHCPSTFLPPSPIDLPGAPQNTYHNKGVSAAVPTVTPRPKNYIPSGSPLRPGRLAGKVGMGGSSVPANSRYGSPPRTIHKREEDASRPPFNHHHSHQPHHYHRPPSCSARPGVLTPVNCNTSPRHHLLAHERHVYSVAPPPAVANAHKRPPHLLQHTSNSFAHFSNNCSKSHTSVPVSQYPPTSALTGYPARGNGGPHRPQQHQLSGAGPSSTRFNDNATPASFSSSAVPKPCRNTSTVVEPTGEFVSIASGQGRRPIHAPGQGKNVILRVLKRTPTVGPSGGPSVPGLADGGGPSSASGVSSSLPTGVDNSRHTSGSRQPTTQPLVQRHHTNDDKAQLAAAIAGLASYDGSSITQLNAVASEVYKKKAAAAAASAPGRHSALRIEHTSTATAPSALPSDINTSSSSFPFGSPSHAGVSEPSSTPGHTELNGPALSIVASPSNCNQQ